MSEHEIRKLAIERLAVGELTGAAATELEEHLRECSPCSAYAGRVKKEREEFLAEHPYTHIRPATLASSYIKSGELWYEKLFGGFAAPLLRPVLIPVSILILVGVMVVPFVGRFTSDTTLSGYRYKGGAPAYAQLPYIYKRNGAIFESAPSDVFLAGDKVMVFYASAVDQYLTLVSIDSTGAVSFYQPDSKSAVCSIRSGVGTKLAYPLSIDLDETPGPELVVALFSAQAVTTAQVKAWAAGIYAQGKSMTDLEKSVHQSPMAKSTVMTLLLKKN